MGFPGTYALPYALHVDKGSVSSGTVAGLTLSPLVIDSANGEVDFYFSLWFRGTYEARYLQMVLSPFWWINAATHTNRCCWQVLVWNFAHSRWESTPPVLAEYHAGDGATILNGSRRMCPLWSTVDISGPYARVNPDLWRIDPEATATGEPWRTGSLTRTITAEHIDSSGLAAIRLVAWKSPLWDAEYQVSIGAVFGCRSNFPLPRTYQLELGSTFKAAYRGTYELTWEPTTDWIGGVGSWAYQLAEDGGEIRFAWSYTHRPFSLTDAWYDAQAACGGSTRADIDNDDAIEVAAISRLLLGTTYTDYNPAHPVLYTGHEVYATHLLRDLAASDTVASVSGATLIGLDWNRIDEDDQGCRRMTLTAGAP